MIEGENTIDEALIRTLKTHFPSSIVEEKLEDEVPDSSERTKYCESDQNMAVSASVPQSFMLAEGEDDALITMNFELVRAGFRKPQPSKSLLARVAVINMFENLSTSAGREQVERILRDLLSRKARKRQ